MTSPPLKCWNKWGGVTPWNFSLVPPPHTPLSGGIDRENRLLTLPLQLGPLCEDEEGADQDNFAT